MVKALPIILAHPPLVFGACSGKAEHGEKVSILHEFTLPILVKVPVMVWRDFRRTLQGSRETNFLPSSSKILQFFS